MIKKNVIYIYEPAQVNDAFVLNGYLNKGELKRDISIIYDHMPDVEEIKQGQQQLVALLEEWWLCSASTSAALIPHTMRDGKHVNCKSCAEENKHNCFTHLGKNPNLPVELCAGIEK